SAQTTPVYTGGLVIDGARTLSGRKLSFTPGGGLGEGDWEYDVERDVRGERGTRFAPPSGYRGYFKKQQSCLAWFAAPQSIKMGTVAPFGFSVGSSTAPSATQVYFDTHSDPLQSP